MAASVYNRLPRDPPTIRLLSILPLGADDRLELTVKPVALAEALGQYTAISYTWGPITKAKLACVNGTIVSLRENIWNCLHHLAQTQDNIQTYYLWADAICINQDDHQEKESQVSLMGQTFACADSVLVWLGSVSSDHLLGCALKKYFDWGLISHLHSWECHQIAGQYSIDGLIYEENGNLVPSGLNLLMGASGMVPQNAGSSHPLRNNVREVFQSDYWNRLWIVQEVLLAQRVWIVLGPHLLNFRSDFQFLEELSTRELGIEISDSCGRLLFGLSSPRSIHRKERLAGVLRQYENQQCSNPHDKIYGLFGVAQEDGVWNIDYSCSKEELCLRTIAYVRGIHRQDLSEGHLDQSENDFVLQALEADRDILRAMLLAPNNPESSPADLCFGRRYRFEINAYSVLTPINHEEEALRTTELKDDGLAVEADGCLDHYRLLDIDSGEISEVCYPRSDFMTTLGYRYATDDSPGSSSYLLECEIDNRDLFSHHGTILLRRSSGTGTVTAAAASYGYGSAKGYTVRKVKYLDSEKVQCLTNLLTNSGIDWGAVWQGYQTQLTASCAAAERAHFEELDHYLSASSLVDESFLDQPGQRDAGLDYSSWYERHRPPVDGSNIPDHGSRAEGRGGALPFMPFEEFWSAAMNM